MNTRLKVICILIALAYLFTIGRSIYLGFPDAKAGFMDGYAGEKRSNTMFIHLKPVEGNYIYPSTFLNQLTGEPVKAQTREVVVKIEDDSHAELPQWLIIADASTIFVTLSILFVIVYVPIQTFKVIKSIVKNEIFDAKNIKRVRRIGYSILFFYFGEWYCNWIDELQAHYRIAIDGYVFTAENTTTLLVFGLVVLLFAEMLRISLKLKEENDLTV